MLTPRSLDRKVQPCHRATLYESKVLMDKGGTKTEGRLNDRVIGGIVCRLGVCAAGLLQPRKRIINLPTESHSGRPAQNECPVLHQVWSGLLITVALGEVVVVCTSISHGCGVPKMILTLVRVPSKGFRASVQPREAQLQQQVCQPIWDLGVEVVGRWAERAVCISSRKSMQLHHAGNP